MLETEATNLECPFHRPNKCVGSGCLGWVFDDLDKERWNVIKGTTEQAMLPSAGAGASATITRPGEGVSKLWEWAGDKGNYDVWEHAPVGGVDGHCEAILK